MAESTREPEMVARPSPRGSSSLEEFEARMRDAGYEEWEISDEVAEASFVAKMCERNTQLMREEGRFVGTVPFIRRADAMRLTGDPEAAIDVIEHEVSTCSCEDGLFDEREVASVVEEPVEVFWEERKDAELSDGPSFVLTDGREVHALVEPGEGENVWSAVIIDGAVHFGEQCFNSPQEAFDFCENNIVGITPKQMQMSASRVQHGQAHAIPEPPDLRELVVQAKESEAADREGRMSTKNHEDHDLGRTERSEQ